MERRRAAEPGSSMRLLKDVSPHDSVTRVSTGLVELDRVLGGGVVPGAVILIGGDPGVGKSTLLLQVAAEISSNMPLLYVSGEESAQQISLRAKRLGLDGGETQLLFETCVERVLEIATQVKPAVLVIDSIQTVYSEVLQSAPGAVGQLREATSQLVRFAKDFDTAVFLVGHVTKEGIIAGPRVLEHMVDTVLYFENDSGSRYRVIRAVKNRFGAVNEIGLFAMVNEGLKEVSNPSAIFISRHEGDVTGSVITVTREGSRPMLVEIQALVDNSNLGNPRRVTVGLEYNRLAMLLAVLHRHGGCVISNHDVFVNAVGGLRLSETAVDLAMLVAVVSSLRGIPVARDLVIFGEVGLAGEIRPVFNGEERLREAIKHGYRRAILPSANLTKKMKIDGIETVSVDRLDRAIAAVFP